MEIVLKAVQPNNLLLKLCTLWRHLAIVLNVDEPEFMNFLLFLELVHLEEMVSSTFILN